MVSQQTVSTVILLVLLASVGYLLYTQNTSKPAQEATQQEQYAYIASDMEQYTNPTYLG